MTDDELFVLEEPLRDLAKAQMQAGVASITLTPLANGDVVASIMSNPGDKTVPLGTIKSEGKAFGLVRPGAGR